MYINVKPITHWNMLKTKHCLSSGCFKWEQKRITAYLCLMQIYCLVWTSKKTSVQVVDFKKTFEDKVFVNCVIWNMLWWNELLGWIKHIGCTGIVKENGTKLQKTSNLWNASSVSHKLKYDWLAFTVMLTYSNQQGGICIDYWLHHFANGFGDLAALSMLLNILHFRFVLLTVISGLIHYI